MKTAAQVVVNSPVGHFRKSMGDPIEEGLIFRVLMVAEEKLVNTCIRKFRCSTQSTVLGIVGARDLFGGFSNDVWREITLALDRKSTRLNSSHITISYAVFCL